MNNPTALLLLHIGFSKSLQLCFSASPFPPHTTDLLIPTCTGGGHTFTMPTDICYFLFLFQAMFGLGNNFFQH